MHSELVDIEHAKLKFFHEVVGKERGRLRISFFDRFIATFKNVRPARKLPVQLQLHQLSVYTNTESTRTSSSSNISAAPPYSSTQGICNPQVEQDYSALHILQISTNSHWFYYFLYFLMYFSVTIILDSFDCFYFSYCFIISLIIIERFFQKLF